MLLEYQLDWIKIVDFLKIAKFWASPDNYDSPSTISNYRFSFIQSVCSTCDFFFKRGNIIRGRSSITSIFFHR